MLSSSRYLWSFSSPVGIVFHIALVLAVLPGAAEQASVRRLVLSVPVRLAILPLALVPAAVGCVVAAVAVLEAALPVAGIAAAFAQQRSLALGPALLERAFVAVGRFAVDEPFQQAVAVGQAVPAGTAPFDGFARLRERIGDLAAAAIGDPGDILVAGGHRTEGGKHKCQQQKNAGYDDSVDHVRLL